MTSNYCSECVINWSPHHTRGEGTCPGCGSGTVRRQEPISDEAEAMYKEVIAQEVKQHKYEMFEEFYAKREAERIANAEPEVQKFIEGLEEFAK